MAHTTVDTSLGYLGWSKQAANSTPVAPAAWVQWRSLDAGPQQKVELYTDGYTRDPSLYAKLGEWFDGKATWFATPDYGIQPILYTLGGADTKIASQTTEFQHTVPSVQTALSYMTVGYSQGNNNAAGAGSEVYQVTDCLWTDLELSSKAGEPLFITGGAKGRIAVPGSAASTVLYKTDRVMTFADGALTFNGMNAAQGDITEIKLGIKQSIDDVFSIGSQSPIALQAGKRTWPVTVTAWVPDTKLFRDIYHDASGAGTATGVPVTPTVATSIVAVWTVALGSVNHSFQLTYNNVVLKIGKAVFSPDAKAFLITAEGEASAVSPGGTVCTAVAINARSTTYA